MIAIDYVELDVIKNAFRALIMHEYLTFSSQINDVIHSIRTVKAVFFELSRNFVAVDHF